MSKYCRHCGAELKSENSKYCDECGMPVNEQIIRPINYQQNTHKKENKESISLGKVITILTMIVIIIGLCSVLYVNIDKLMSITGIGTASNQYSEGTYKVGVDIPAGEYKFTTTSDTGGYVECSRDSSMELESIISNDLTDKSGEVMYVTVNDGEYLKVDGGYLTPA